MAGEVVFGPGVVITFLLKKIVSFMLVEKQIRAVCISILIANMWLFNIMSASITKEDLLRFWVTIEIVRIDTISALMMASEERDMMAQNRMVI